MDAAISASLAALVLLAIVISILVIRRKRQRQALTLASEQYDKPQLHAEDFDPHREELLGSLGKPRYDHTVIPELPAG